MSKRKKTVVTGGCGFVGAHLVDALVKRGDDVTVLDMAKSAPREDIRYVRADISDAAVVSDAIAGADCVYHNASVVHTKQNLVDKVWAVNLGGSRNVLEACRRHGVTKLVYVSSASAVY